jgi:hypothetical protein
MWSLHFLTHLARGELARRFPGHWIGQDITTGATARLAALQGPFLTSRSPCNTEQYASAGQAVKGRLPNEVRARALSLCFARAAGGWISFAPVCCVKQTTATSDLELISRVTSTRMRRNFEIAVAVYAVAWSDRCGAIAPPSQRQYRRSRCRHGGLPRGGNGASPGTVGVPWRLRSFLRRQIRGAHGATSGIVARRHPPQRRCRYAERKWGGSTSGGCSHLVLVLRCRLESRVGITQSNSGADLMEVLGGRVGAEYIVAVHPGNRGPDNIDRGVSTIRGSHHLWRGGW